MGSGDPSAQVIERYAYDAYGQTLAGAGLTAADAAKTTWLFAGDGQYDRASQLTNHIDRWRQGHRFLSLDPFAGNAHDPLSLHKYLYAHANPVMLVDPSGLFSLGGVSVANSIGSMLAGMQANAGSTVLETLDGLRSGLSVDQAYLSVLATNAVFGAVGLGVTAGTYIGARALLFAGETVVGYAQVARGLVLPGTILTRARMIPGEVGQIIGGNSTALKKNLLRASGIKAGIPVVGFQAHHIIPTQLGKEGHPILSRIGMNLDHASNGILLPKKIHFSRHDDYTRAVREALDSIPLNATLQRQMEMVYEIQAKAVRAFSEQGASLQGANRTSLAQWRRFLQ